MSNVIVRKNTSQYIINREISWLHFNERVLQEAIDPSTPLIERIKFLGIFSNNRDEFFRVRVASLNRMLKIVDKIYSQEDNPKEVLAKIKEIVLEQERLFTKTYNKIVKELANHDIYIINCTCQGVRMKRFHFCHKVFIPLNK